MAYHSGKSSSGHIVQELPSMHLDYRLNPRRISLFLGSLALYLAAQSLFGEYVLGTVLATQSDSVPALLLDLFSVNAEQTIPTWYAVCLLLVAAALLAVIAAAKRTTKDSYHVHWLGLAVIFLYLSIDEGAVIHEIVAEPLQIAFNTSGFLLFGWQLVALPLVVIFALMYLRFLRHLPRRIQMLFSLAGALYAGGALFVEAISANQLSVDRDITIPYLAIGTVEELCEMLGVIVLIYALLVYVAEMQYRFVFRSAFVAQETAQATVTPAQATNGSGLPRPFPLVRVALLVVVLVVGVNLAVVYWALSQPPASKPGTGASPAIFQSLVDQADGMQVAHINGLFGVDNPTARQFVASLLAVFDQVMVVTLPESQSSIVLAGDMLPLDRNSLAELLRANGETRFIIFDTPGVRAVVGNLQPK